VRYERGSTYSVRAILALHDLDENRENAALRATMGCFRIWLVCQHRSGDVRMTPVREPSDGGPDKDAAVLLAAALFVALVTLGVVL
jgi:hypothetical protein